MPSLPTTYVILTPTLVPLHIEATNISMKIPPYNYYGCSWNSIFGNGWFY